MFSIITCYKLKLKAVGDKSQNSFATESTLNFSGPYRRVQPVKLTNQSARTKRYNNAPYRLVFTSDRVNWSEL